MKKGRIVISALASVVLASCFTGIESTPRISSGDVRKHDAATLTAEQQFLSEIKPAIPSEWATGKRFYITDDKISIIFLPGETSTDSLTGHDLVFERFEFNQSVTGEDNVRAVFHLDDNAAELVYPLDVTPKDFKERKRLEVPFTVERSVVEAVDSAMIGQTYYISTPKWYKASDDKAVKGLRHIPVKIDRVDAGTYIYPLRVYFTCEGEGYWIPMTIGTDRSATKNFAAVFNFDNPRVKYPLIKDETWDLIVHSRVAEGMTRDECRLALGAPNSYRTIPTINAIVEQWSYDDGMYLMFEDGILTRFRI